MMRIVFCGSGPFAVASLRGLLATNHEVVSIITQPARRAGRGVKLRRTPLAEAAAAAGREARQCPDINSAEAVASIRAAEADVVCVVDFGQMVRPEVREPARLGAFNLHGSLLPELRGAAPVNWAIIRGCERTGVTTFSLVDRMDAGPIYLQAETDIRPGETAAELRDRLAELGAAVVCDTAALLEAGSLHGRPQDESLATLAPRLKKSDGVIRWDQHAEAIANLIHGTWPWPGGQAVFQRKDGPPATVTIARAAVESDGPSLRPGLVDEQLRVAAGSGRLGILEIKPAGRRLMKWRDFVNGYRVSQGDCFVSAET